MESRIYLQITSGRGPVECCRAVALILEKILRQAQQRGLETEVVFREPGSMNRTLVSAILSLQGKGCDEFADEWNGTIQWIGQSPYRIHHKRKNWFVGVNSYKMPRTSRLDERDIVYQTLRASGPGGQHVNKTESAVRAVHSPSGISVTASDQRSQLQNKKLATERLMLKLMGWFVEQAMEVAHENWNNHNQLQRGNPVKVIQESL